MLILPNYARVRMCMCISIYFNKGNTCIKVILYVNCVKVIEKRNKLKIIYISLHRF